MATKLVARLRKHQGNGQRSGLMQAAYEARYPNYRWRNADINSDGTYPSFKDINPFVGLLSSGPQMHRGDLNCDGTYGQSSFDDMNPFVQYLSNFSAWQVACPGCPP